MVISEAGWTDAVGALAAIGGKARKTSETHLQTTDVAADYYSRYIPITRAAHNVRTVTFYSLVDEGPPDPDKKNVQGHFGVFVDANTPKPSVAVAKELFDHMHAAVGAEMYTRSGTSGQEDTTADWFVRLDTAQSHELVAWTAVQGGRNAQVAVNAQQPGTLTIKLAGTSSTSEVTLTQGEQVVTVPLGARSVILSSSVPVTFPEFK